MSWGNRGPSLPPSKLPVGPRPGGPPWLWAWGCFATAFISYFSLLKNEELVLSGNSHSHPGKPLAWGRQAKTHSSKADEGRA